MDLAGQSSRHSARGRFYWIMSLILAAIVIFGFSHTVPADFSPPGLPVLLQLHGLIFGCWVLLFIVQPVLIARGSLRRHRQLGRLGGCLVVAMLALGTYAILFALWVDATPFFYPHGLFIVRGFLGLALFGGLTAAAIINRRRADWHKRLMLCASIVVIVPGLERALPVPIMGPNWPFVVDAVVDLLALVGPAVDWATRRRIHPAYFWGVGAIVCGQILTDLIAPSPIATTLLRLVGAH
jgi:uncharacterized membrane protein YozB (DUF420 family)